MTLPRPDAELTVDGRRLTAAQAGLAGVTVELGVGHALDGATLQLSSFSPVIDVAPAATLQIALGHGDGYDAAFTGSVVAVSRTPWGAVVEGLTDATVLARARLGRSYLSQTAADVARDLIESGGGRPGRVEAPLDLPAYHVSEARSVWRHLVGLAALTGSTLRSAPDGAVDLIPVRPVAPDHRLRAGAELLWWEAGEVGAVDDAPVVAPAGAGSEAGTDRWQFLLAEPEGGSPSEPTVVLPAVRTRDGARAVADALAAAVRRRRRGGWALAVGAWNVRAGDVVALADVAGGGDEPWRVLEARHTLGADGLQSRLRLEAAA